MSKAAPFVSIVEDPQREVALPYSETSLEAALAAVRVHHAPLPEAFRWAGSANRDGMDPDTFEEAWSSMTLEKRVGHAAVLIGPSCVPGPDATVTAAYMDLCRRGGLRFEADLEPVPVPGLR